MLQTYRRVCAHLGEDEIKVTLEKDYDDPVFPEDDVLIVYYKVRGERFSTEFRTLDQLMTFLDGGAVLDRASDQFEWQPCEAVEYRPITS